MLFQGFAPVHTHKPLQMLSLILHRLFRSVILFFFFFFYSQLSLCCSLSASCPELPHSACDKLTGGRGGGLSKGQKKPLSFSPRTSLPAHTRSHARSHTHITHAHAQGWLAVRRLPWRQDQGEKERKQSDRWCKG